MIRHLSSFRVVFPAFLLASVILPAGYHVAEASDGAGKATLAEARAPRVTVMSARPAELLETIPVTGTLLPRDEVLVGPEIEGHRILEILAEEGDSVKRGQVLARLSREVLDVQLGQNDASLVKSDAAIAQARSQISQMEAALTQSRQSLERTTTLRKSGFASQAIYDQQLNDNNANVARLQAARDGLALSEADRKVQIGLRNELLLRLARTEVKSPADGLVSRRTAKVGAVASLAADPLFRIIANGEIELEAEVPELRIGRIRAGNPTVVDSEGKSVPAIVRLVSTEVDRTSRQGKVRVSLSNSSGLRVGSFARGTIETERVTAIAIPLSAVLYTETGGAMVQIVREGKIVSSPVTLGVVSGDRAAVISGIKEGDIFVSKAGSFLRQGDAVNPVEAPVGAPSQKDAR